MENDKESGSKSKESEKPLCLSNFAKLIESKRGKTAAIFAHAMPDPDAIGSMMAMHWLLQKCGIESYLFYEGTVSHPQNRALVNLLDPGMRPVDEYKAGEFDFHILVDTVPANAGIGRAEVKFDLVIDHHREVPNGGFNGLFVNLKAGSCCATVYHLIKSMGYVFEDDNDNDSKVATAIMVGISTDTESLMSDDATNLEFDAWAELFEFRNHNFIKKIIHWERPKYWIDHEAEAVKNAVVCDGVCVVGLGIIPARHRDMISDMADQLVTWEDVNTAVAFAMVEGDRLEGSVRSHNTSIIVSDLCKELAGKHGKGGGKQGKGAYRYALAGGSIEEEEDDETKNETWELFNKKEVKRLMRIMQR
jgi:nanoRNase/pAp phosphatase (c-di-AMP/oligoRNAs hydrolase)